MIQFCWTRHNKF